MCLQEYFLLCLNMNVYVQITSEAIAGPEGTFSHGTCEGLINDVILCSSIIFRMCSPQL